MDTPKKMKERREKERYREGGRDKRERERERERERSKEKSLNLKSYTNRIFTPESITFNENYDAKIMTQKL